MLALQSTKSNISVESIDQQFLSLLKTVEKYFEEQEFDLLFEWLTELIKKEGELKRKQQEDFRVYQKDSINLLICKVSMFHARIIEILVNAIDDAYYDYRVISETSPLFGNKVKTATIFMANAFINHLTENRNINVILIDQYIDLISQELQIFNI